MTDFSQKRFVDIGQELYIEWVKNYRNFTEISEEGRRKVFNLAATVAFEAAEEFAEVFRHQEDN